MDRLTGRVKWFSVPKGYGFIVLEDGREIFVHYTAIEGNGFRGLAEGEIIDLSLLESETGLKAHNVTRLSEVASR